MASYQEILKSNTKYFDVKPVLNQTPALFPPTKKKSSNDIKPLESNKNLSKKNTLKLKAESDCEIDGFEELKLKRKNITNTLKKKKKKKEQYFSDNNLPKVNLRPFSDLEFEEDSSQTFSSSSGTNVLDLNEEEQKDIDHLFKSATKTIDKLQNKKFKKILQKEAKAKDEFDSKIKEISDSEKEEKNSQKRQSPLGEGLRTFKKSNTLISSKNLLNKKRLMLDIQGIEEEEEEEKENEAENTPKVTKNFKKMNSMKNLPFNNKPQKANEENKQTLITQNTKKILFPNLNSKKEFKINLTPKRKLLYPEKSNFKVDEEITNLQNINIASQSKNVLKLARTSYQYQMLKVEVPHFPRERILYLWERAQVLMRGFIAFRKLTVSMQLYGTTDAQIINNRKPGKFISNLKRLQTDFDNQILEKQEEVTPNMKCQECFDKVGNFIPKIYPDTPFHLFWNAVTSIVLLNTALVTPFSIAFGSSDPGNGDTKVFENIIDCIFITDVMLAFNTCYYNAENIIVESRREIAVTYLRAWFVVDFLASIPQNLIIDNAEINESITKEVLRNSDALRLMSLPKIYRILRVVRIIKLFRAFKKIPWIGKVQDFFDINYGKLYIKS